MAVVKARAPCRISLAGGGTDFPEFFEEYGGAVLNFGIDLYSYTSFIRNERLKDTKITSYDWNFTRNINNLNLEFEKNTENNVDIVKAVMASANLDPKDGYELVISSSAPKNSGLAGSSALLTSILGSLYNYAGKSLMQRTAIANTAYSIERKILRRAGGMQDQFAAVFGGFNFMEFKREYTYTSPLRLEAELLCELHSSMLIFETPYERKVSASTLEGKKIIEMEDNIECLKNITELAYNMKHSLMYGDVKYMGELLDYTWKEKRKISGVSNKEIDHLIKIAKDNGAWGVKLCGAGGGGSLFIMCDLSDRKKIINRMTFNGCKQINFNFDYHGLTSWRTD